MLGTAGAWIIDPGLEIDLDHAVFNANREAWNRKPVRIFWVESGSNVEWPAMGFADDDAPLEFPFREWKTGVWTAIFHRIDMIVDTVEAHFDSIDAHAKSAVARYINDWGDGHEGHAYSLINFSGSALDDGFAACPS